MIIALLRRARSNGEVIATVSVVVEIVVLLCVAVAHASWISICSSLQFRGALAGRTQDGFPCLVQSKQVFVALVGKLQRAPIIKIGEPLIGLIARVPHRRARMEIRGGVGVHITIYSLTGATLKVRHYGTNHSCTCMIGADQSSPACKLVVNERTR